jgi:hypothetical protein
MASVTVIGGSGFLGRRALKIMGARALRDVCNQTVCGMKSLLWHEKLGTGRGSTSL